MPASLENSSLRAERKARPAVAYYAPLAQLVEQLTLNQWVLGSSPRWCTIEASPQGGWLFRCTNIKMGCIGDSNSTGCGVRRVGPHWSAAKMGSVECRPRAACNRTSGFALRTGGPEARQAAVRSGGQKRPGRLASLRLPFCCAKPLVQSPAPPGRTDCPPHPRAARLWPRAPNPAGAFFLCGGHCRPDWSERSGHPLRAGFTLRLRLAIRSQRRAANLLRWNGSLPLA